MRLYVAILVAALIALAGVLFGLWWAPFLAALGLGALQLRARIAVPTGALIGLLAWLIPLAAMHARYGLGPTAASIATIMGFTHQAAVPVTLTLVVGALLGLCGAWLGSAARALAQPAVR